MAKKNEPLSRKDKADVFRIATKGLLIRYQKEVATGLNDEDLAALLELVLGIFGGTDGPNRLSVTYQGSGLKIWGGWHVVNHVIETPIFQGMATVKMARELYKIPDPDEDQLALF